MDIFISALGRPVFLEERGALVHRRPRWFQIVRQILHIPLIQSDGMGRSLLVERTTGGRSCDSVCFVIQLRLRSR